MLCLQRCAGLVGVRQAAVLCESGCNRNGRQHRWHVYISTGNNRLRRCEVTAHRRRHARCRQSISDGALCEVEIGDEEGSERNLESEASTEA